MVVELSRVEVVVLFWWVALLGRWAARTVKLGKHSIPTLTTRLHRLTQPPSIHHTTRSLLTLTLSSVESSSTTSVPITAMSSRGIPEVLFQKVDDYVDSLAPQIQLRIASELELFQQKVVICYSQR